MQRGQNTYVNEGLLYFSVSRDSFVCHVLMPEPGADRLQGSVGTAPTAVIDTILQTMFPDCQMSCCWCWLEMHPESIPSRSLNSLRVCVPLP